jgi:endonuclease YncB( thermonuclease family)
MARGLRLEVTEIVAAVMAVAWPAAVAAQGVSATVLSIGDGDTIRVRQADRGITVRLACIDAPETAQGTYGQQARVELQQRLPIGREIRLAVQTTDRYGRSVAEVFSGVNINLALVENGLAFVYRQYLGGCDARAYLAAEDRASRARLGRTAFSRHPGWHHSRRAPLPLQRNRLLCPRPAAAAPGAYLPRWQRRWGSL